MNLQNYMEKQSPFGRMVIGALLGIILGIGFGLIFSLIISAISNSLTTTDFPPAKDYGASAFFGMGFGAIIGGIMGGAISSRK